MVASHDRVLLDAVCTHIVDLNSARDGVSLRGVRVPQRLRVDELHLPACGHLLVEGTNGSGKSTLLGVLSGRITPAAGSVWRRHSLRVGLLEQDVRTTAGHRIIR